MHTFPERPAGWLGAALVCLAASSLLAAPSDRFPEVRPATRVQAVTVLTGGAPLSTDCLTPRLQTLLYLPTRADTTTGGPAVRRALAVLGGSFRLADEQRWVSPGGHVWRYTAAAGSFDRVDLDDRDGDGVPDAFELGMQGLDRARAVLVEQLGLPDPGAVEILVADLGRHVSGYALPSAAAQSVRPLMVISPTHGERSDLAVAHQYAHLVLTRLEGAVPSGWAEALAHWLAIEAGQGPSEAILELMAQRASRLAEGLLSDDLDLQGGNVLWLSFMAESYGATSVGRLARELSSGPDVLAALQRAVLRASGQTLREAFREFHLWTVLAGERDDGRHFSFGSRLPSPRFAGVTDGLPALSVQRDPPLGPLGAAQVLLRPEEHEGGLTLLFEGALAAEWDADVLLVQTDGRLYRAPVPLNEDGRGELTVPLDRLRQAILLVRNVNGEHDGAARRYTWSAHRERGFPFELGALEASAAGEQAGVQVRWETLSENQLLGFNVLRTHPHSGETTRINPVWIPALGDGVTAVSYEFLDTTADPGLAYLYRIEGITVHGLTSLSEPIPSTRFASRH